MQHDAHELIRLLIDRLERDMKLSKVNAGLVSALYEGDLANQVSSTVVAYLCCVALLSALLSYRGAYFCCMKCQQHQLLYGTICRTLPGWHSLIAVLRQHGLGVLLHTVLLAPTLS